MKGDEEKVVAAFSDWLRCAGWDVHTEVDYVDVVAERDGERLLCEAKGTSSVVGLDVDLAYGQILRRMPEHDDPGGSQPVPARLGTRGQANRRPMTSRPLPACNAAERAAPYRRSASVISADMNPAHSTPSTMWAPMGSVTGRPDTARAESHTRLSVSLVTVR